MFFAFETVEIFCRLHYNLGKVRTPKNAATLQHPVVYSPQVGKDKNRLKNGSNRSVRLGKHRKLAR